MNWLFNFQQSTLPLYGVDSLCFNEHVALMLGEIRLFASDAAGAGGRKATTSDEQADQPADKPTTQPPHASITPAGDPDQENGNQEENLPGLQAKEGRYFKSDTQADTGIGNV